MRSLSKLQSLFATALGVTACGAGSVDRSALTEDTCSGATNYDPLAGVTAGSSVDYMELRQTFGLATNPATVISKSGTACATATDPATCNATLATIASANGWQLAPGGGLSPTITEYLVYTREDEVGMVTSYDALKAFIAPVDNVHDAALLASQSPTTRFTIVCGPKTGGAVAGGFEVVAETGDTCGQGTHLDEDLVFASSSGDVSIEQAVTIKQGDPNCVSGRRPEGLVPAARRCNDAVGAFFAECAHLEAASVLAFERLARELRAHGAPARLVRAAERSRGDEIRHAKVTTALARRYGAEPEAVVVENRDVRSLFEIALENAVEGCVRETYGALVAMHQTEHATDARVAAAMRRIARDETRHAALAWDIAEWIDARLTRDERKRVADARTLAATTMRRQLSSPIASDLENHAGLPSSEQGLALFDAIATSLWAA